MSRPLAVVILTLNEEQNLPDALASLRGLDADVYVVDSGSTDRTVKIAEEWGATVAEHPFENYGLQRNWALDRLGITADWVLHLDADERLTPELRDGLLPILAAAPPDVAGYRLQQRTHWMGRWIKHGGFHPFYQMRLHRRGKGRCEERLYDQRFLAEGNVGQIDLAYVNVVTDSLSNWTARHNRWSTLEATTRVEGDESRKDPRFRDPIERRHWMREKVYYRRPMFLRAFLYFLYRYVARGGFLDGREGLVFHVLHGFWYRFLVDCKIYELQRERAKENRA